MQVHAHKLQIGRARRKWSPRELNIVSHNWHTLTPRQLAEKLPGRTPYAIYEVATRKDNGVQQGLELPTGTPQGCLSLKKAAERSGLSRKAFVKLLRDRGVQVKTFNYLHGTDKRRRLFVEVDAVDAVVQEWVSEETPNDAARRLKVAADWLRKKMVKLGYDLPYNTPVRHPPEVYDRVVGRTIKEEAARLGVTPDALRSALHRYNCGGNGGRKWRLKPGDAEKALGRKHGEPELEEDGRGAGDRARSLPGHREPRGSALEGRRQAAWQPGAADGA